MFEPRVKVIGLGTTISYEMKVIQEALESAGYDVTIEDEYPNNEFAPDVKEIVKGNKITLQACHLPWPG